MKNGELIVAQFTYIRAGAISQSRHLPKHVNRDDVFGFVIVRMLREVESYDPRRASLKRWISTRLSFAVTDAVRSLKPWSRSAVRVTEDQLVSPDSLLAEEMIPNSASYLIGGTLAELPQRWADVLRMYFYEDLSMREIAGVLGVTECRISQIVARALTTMRKSLRKRGVRKVGDVI